MAYTEEYRQRRKLYYGMKDYNLEFFRNLIPGYEQIPIAVVNRITWIDADLHIRQRRYWRHRRRLERLKGRRDRGE